MALTSTTQSISNSSEAMAEKLSTDGVTLTVRPGNPFKQVDYGLIIKAFELETANWAEEDYALAYHYKDVYSTENFSYRVREQMDYYPGMHQSSNPPEENPFKTEAEEQSEKTLHYWDNAMDNPSSFMNGLRSRQEDFDYTTIFGSNSSAEERAKEVGKMITECVPCFGELKNIGNLLPDGDLLEIHAMNIKIRTDIVNKIKTLFDDPGAYVDICELLKLLSHICPKHLLAILIVLSQYLAKLNLDIKFNIDFIIQLVGPILSPFLDGLAQWLDKWIQLIITPLICVVDSINETIITAQNAKIPFSAVSGDVSADIGVALPFHTNLSSENNIGGAAGTGTNTDGQSYAGGWGKWQFEKFNTPDSEKYNPEIPVYPSEETQMAREEMAEAWSPSFSEVEREERDRRWAELKEAEDNKRKEVPPPLDIPNRNGQRWSKDDIPNSEKYVTGGQFDVGDLPPEEQRRPNEAIAYFDASSLVNSIVQLRNILQGSIQYVNDWFTYVTQMIYDLLGVDIGWMDKKADTTMLKSRIIQLIMMVKAVLKAFTENGLECGVTSSGLTQSQVKFIIEEGLNKNVGSAVSLKIQDDGTITLTPVAEVQDSTTDKKQVTETSGTIPGETVTEPSVNTKEPVQSGTITKDCFKDMSSDDFEKASKWIADFNKRKI